MNEHPPIDDDPEGSPGPSGSSAVLEVIDRTIWQVLEAVPASLAKPVEKLTPAERRQLIDIAAELRRVEEAATRQRRIIEATFREYAARANAKQIPLEGGILEVKIPPGEYRVNIPALRAELTELMAHGLITEEEIDSAFRVTVEEKADNTRLNYLARNRGDEVADAINRHREQLPGDPSRARLSVKERA